MRKQQLRKHLIIAAWIFSTSVKLRCTFFNRLFYSIFTVLNMKNRASVAFNYKYDFNLSTIQQLSNVFLLVSGLSRLNRRNQLGIYTFYVITMDQWQVEGLYPTHAHWKYALVRTFLQHCYYIPYRTFCSSFK